MDTKDTLDRLLHVIGELTAFYGELSGELPELRVVADNTRAYSDVKKTLPGRYFIFPVAKTT